MIIISQLLNFIMSNVCVREREGECDRITTSRWQICDKENLSLSIKLFNLPNENASRQWWTLYSLPLLSLSSSPTMSASIERQAALQSVIYCLYIVLGFSWEYFHLFICLTIFACASFKWIYDCNVGEREREIDSVYMCIKYLPCFGCVDVTPCWAIALFGAPPWNFTAIIINNT